MIRRTVCAVLSTAAATAALASPIQLTHQSRVLDANGTPINGQHDVTITLYEDGSTTSHVWQHTYSLDLDDGYVNVVVGAAPGPLLDTDAFGDQLWMAVDVDSIDVGPRTRLSTVPFAAHAQVAESLADDAAQTLIDASGGWCPGHLVGGVCFAGFGHPQPFLQASLFCAAKNADICSDSQNTVLRDHGFDVGPSWTRSFADNDAGAWTIANGGTGDDHGSASNYGVPCCHNLTPSQPGETTVGGVRLISEYNAGGVYWRAAVSTCALQNADLCTEAESQVLRDNGRLAGGPSWTSSHADNDNSSATHVKGNGGTNDNTYPTHNYRFACCASQQPIDLSCPAPATSVNGVCMVSVNNSTGTWSQAATSCASQQARVCSISQTAVLRSAGVVTASGSWTGSYSDNDSNHASVGVGSVGDDHPNTSQYGWACCY